MLISREKIEEIGEYLLKYDGDMYYYNFRGDLCNNIIKNIKKEDDIINYLIDKLIFFYYS